MTAATEKSQLDSTPSYQAAVGVMLSWVQSTVPGPRESFHLTLVHISLHIKLLSKLQGLNIMCPTAEFQD